MVPRLKRISGKEMTDDDTVAKESVFTEKLKKQVLQYAMMGIDVLAKGNVH